MSSTSIEQTPKKEPEVVPAALAVLDYPDAFADLKLPPPTIPGDGVRIPAEICEAD